MKIYNFSPHELLKSFIHSYKIIESEEIPLFNRILPGTALTLAFRFRGSTAYVSTQGNAVLPAATFSGLRKTARIINYMPHTSVLVILFKETGASAFFKIPLQELFEESISLEHLVHSPEVAAIEEILCEASTHNERILVIEEFLISRLMIFKPDPVVEAALKKIYSSGGLIKMKTLAESISLSQDAFEKRFRKVVGASPKQFASIARMKSIIEKKKKDHSILDLSFDGGYFDAAHFHKEFKLFTGQTPADFFKTIRYW
ncbi:MAG TPA: helix-turn-helix domain-containing protein [Cytophagaceae bacterium]|nr:helix-turn-helix domain-containing protein [Cytophagaceae bacterium]